MNSTVELFPACWGWFRRERFLSAMILLLPVLLLVAPGRGVGELVGLVDWRTVAALTGLMLLSKALELSGILGTLGMRLLAYARSERGLAGMLICFAALLSMIITNDVALFVIIPITVVLSRRVRIHLPRIIVFQALAVNAGSSLSPIGNPQNLFLWQSFEIGFWDFFGAMAPLALGMMALLFLLIPIAFPSHPLSLNNQIPAGGPVRRRLSWMTLAVYPVFLILAEAGQAPLAAGLVLLGYLLFQVRVVRQMDWVLPPLFTLMFLNLGLLAELASGFRWVETGLSTPPGLFLSAALTSQVISNVPATIFLAPFTADWIILAWGVSIGGFGLAIGSIANLIAIRLARPLTIAVEFHRWSVPMFALSILLGLLLVIGFVHS